MPVRPSRRWVVIRGRKTSVSLEDAFWNALTEIAGARGISISALVADIDDMRPDLHQNLSSYLRVNILKHYQRLAAQAEQAARSEK
ncbi:MULTISPECIES: ribbon-helix-helix domain-containing protein [unclassified Xanthobacter]|uniref:ribbon-helix-helix domain-containing protein n=1 Tax=unclassified Xanthobacter TaxID=2623496 RepID=UPI001F2A02F0|nr:MULTISPECIES: ribbon-helix-helix domain-containing protein [unclassified Xanthobacter]